MQKDAKLEELVDLRTVQIDTNLPAEERIRSFLRQVKNPYCYKVGDVVVRVAYSESGLTLDECFADMISSM